MGHNKQRKTNGRDQIMNTPRGSCGNYAGEQSLRDYQRRAEEDRRRKDEMGDKEKKALWYTDIMQWAINRRKKKGLEWWEIADKIHERMCREIGRM